MDVFLQIKEFQIRRRVKLIKEFYWFAFVVFLVTVGMFGMAYFLYAQNASSAVIWIFAMMPVVSWVILLIQYVRVFGSGLNYVKRWEANQIKKIMEKGEVERLQKR